MVLLMDFNELVGSSVKVAATVEKIVVDNHTNLEMILLKDVYINGTFFRNHAWLKMTKRLSVLGFKDHFTATASLIHYYDVDTNRKDKLGFKSFRSVCKIA